MLIRERLEDLEHRIYHPRASYSDSTRGRARQEKACTVRPAFQHDRDKILHCKAFRRLLHKTQVFLSPQGDHYRTRMTHTLEVSQIARTLATALRLNDQLTEAIALGHDLGHTPFGHAGEDALNQMIPGGFRHVAQSVRVVEILEKEGHGLNLTWEVLDGIAKHSKGKGKILGGAGHHLPRTLEGQIVRVADIIAYVNHDLDDALRGGVLRLQDVPKNLLSVVGRTHSQRIARAVKDILKNTDLDRGEGIAMSEDMEQAIVDLRAFLWDRVYENPTVHDEFKKCHTMLEHLFHLLMSDKTIFTRLLGPGPPDCDERKMRMVTDFLAGMTDRFATRLYKELFIPRPWPGSLE